MRRAPSSASPTRAPAPPSAPSSSSRRGRSVTFEELQEYAAESLARYKVPTSVHFLPSLPHSLTGKVSRARLRELGLTGADTARRRGGRRWLTPPPRLQLLTRAGCHLCETAAETLTRIGAEAGLVPEAVDVDADPELQAEYGDRVPGRAARRPGALLLHRRRRPAPAGPRTCGARPVAGLTRKVGR